MMQKYGCNYIYNPWIGDPEHAQPPGTLFEDLPEEWVCPECGLPKTDFEEFD